MAALSIVSFTTGATSGSVAGAVDYRLFGPTDNTKSGGGSTISALSVFGNGALNRYSGDPYTIPYTGGTPSGSGTWTGNVYNDRNDGPPFSQTGDGIDFTLPADTSSRRVRIDLSCYEAVLAVSFHLSDNSAPDVSDNSTCAATTGNVKTGVVTVDYAAASSGQTLRVRITVQTAVGISANIAVFAAQWIFNGGGTTFFKTLTASLTLSAARIIGARAVRAGSLTSAATRAVLAQATRTASTTTSAALAKQARAVRSATSTLAATVLTIKTKLLTLTAGVTITASRLLTVQAMRSTSGSVAAAVVKRAQAVRAATTTPAATVQRLVSATRSASTGCSAALALLKARFMTLTAQVTVSPVLVRSVQAVRAATVTGTAAMLKRANLIRAAATNATATLATIKAKLLTLTATVSSSAVLTRSTKAIRTAATTAGAVLVKRTNAVRAAALAGAATLQKLTAARKNATQALAATVTTSKAKILVLVATVTSSASIAKAVRATRMATSSMLASLATQSSGIVWALLGPVWKITARAVEWLADKRSSHVRAQERTALWVVGGDRAMTNTCDKRTAEEVTYTIDCTPLLDAGETILAVLGITADEGDLEFGTPSKNSVPVVTKDGRVIAIGKALQVRISGGVIPDGRPWLFCYIRPAVSTTLDGATVYNPKREPTVVLRLIDNPPA